jgi:hypothetical protein
VVVIAILILIWAFSFIKEAEIKNGKSADQNCQEVSIDTSIDGDSLAVTNNGNIPIYSLNIEKTVAGSTDLQSEDNINMFQGDSKEIVIGRGYEKVVITPIILAQVKNTNVPHECTNNKKEVLQ